MRPFAVDRDKVFRAWVSLSGSAGAGFLRGLEATVKVSVWERDAVIGSVHRFLKKLFDVVHCDEGCGGGGDHNYWEVIALEDVLISCC